MKKIYPSLLSVGIIFVFLSCEKQELTKENETAVSEEVRFENTNVSELLTLPVFGS